MVAASVVARVVDSREIAVAMMRLGAEVLRALMLGDAANVRRLGLAVASRGGLWCYTSTRLDAGVFNHVSGYGTFAPATQRSIDAALRHFERVRRKPAFEVLVPTVSRADRALLERIIADAYALVAAPRTKMKAKR